MLVVLGHGALLVCDTYAYLSASSNRKCARRILMRYSFACGDGHTARCFVLSAYASICGYTGVSFSLSSKRIWLSQ
jgi:hypothetical protein